MLLSPEGAFQRGPDRIIIIITITITIIIIIFRQDAPITRRCFSERS